jgi:hemerythrin superfamily protein
MRSSGCTIDGVPHNDLESIMAGKDDPTLPVPQTAVPADNPILMLQRDHKRVRALAERYLAGTSIEVKKQAATELLQAIHTHSRVEESVFYPGVRRVEPNLIAHFEEEHLNADDLLVTLQGMRMDAPRAEPLMRELIAAVLEHIDEEENELFPMLRHAALDLTPIGLEMQAFEAALVHRQGALSNGWARH